MTSKLIEALNKCETQKSYENVRYTLVDDELRDYIEESLERLEAINKVWHDNEPMESVDFKAYQLQILYDYINAKEKEIKIFKEENEKLKKVIEIIKKIVSIPLEDDFAKVKIDKETKEKTHFYALSIKYLIDELEYELLKEVLGK